MGVSVPRCSLIATLVLSCPITLATLLAPLEAHAQQAAFADAVFELVPPGEVVADGLSPVTLSFIAFNKDGTPLSGAALKATVGAGKVGAVEQVGPGVYKVSWTPPRVDAGRSFDVIVKGKSSDKLTNIDKHWSVKVVPTLAQQVALTMNPPQLVLGQDATATLNISLSGGPSQPLDGVDLDIRASAGTVANVTHLGGGKFTALYTPPPQPFPQLALITVADRRDPTRTYGSMAISLIGKASFPVTGLPNSRVIVKVADREFGPIQADGAGKAVVPLVVAPGFDKGTLVSVVGDTRKEDPLDLKVPPSTRLAFFPVPKAIPADGAVSVPIRVYVSTSQGASDASAQVTMTATGGTISPVRHEGNGVYSAMFSASAGGNGGQASVTATLQDARGNQTANLALSLVPTRPSNVTLTADPTKLPTTGGSIRVLAHVEGPDKQGLAGRSLAFGVDGAQLQGGVKELGGGDYQAVFNSTGSGAVDMVATVTAKASGNPLRQVLAFASHDRVVNDGLSSTMITVLTLDEYGYPVANVPIKVAVTQGDGKVPIQGKTNDTGVAQIYYTSGRTAGVATLEITAGDHSGAVALLQAPPGVATGLVMPPSGADTTLKLANAWHGIVKSARVEREGVVATPIAAATPSWGGAGSSALPVQKLTVTASPSSAAPGSTVELQISAQDAQGVGVDNASLDFLASIGQIGAAKPTGGGRYTAPLTVPADATGEIKVSVALNDGSVSSFLKIPVSSAVAAAGWGTTTEPTWGGGSTTTPPPTSSTPATTTTPQQSSSATSSTSAATFGATPSTMTGNSDAGTTKVKTPRTKTLSSDDDSPWLRARVGYAGSLYSFAQEASDVGSPLYANRIAFGSFSEQESAKAAIASGAEVAARAWLPGARWLGVDLGFQSTYYSVSISKASDAIPDWVTRFHADVVPRYRFGGNYHVGGRVGFSAGDMMIYQQPAGSSTLSYSPLSIPALDLGAELGMDMDSGLFGTLGYTIGLANASSFYAHGLDLGLGYSFSDRLFAGLSVGSSSRTTAVYLSPNDPRLSKQEVGDISDKALQLSVGIGYQL